MTAADALDRGREAFGRRAWADAFARLSAADRRSPLEAEDLERLATAAYLLWRLDGLSEYDVRRPMVPTGTNLLGLVKHMATIEARPLDAIGQVPWWPPERDSGPPAGPRAGQGRGPRRCR